MKQLTSLLTIFAVLAFAIPNIYANYYVDAVNGSDENSGYYPDKPFKTITYALNLYYPQPTDVTPPSVYVAPGIYNMANGEIFPLVIRDGWDYMKSKLIGADRDTTIIDATGSGESAIVCLYGSIENLTITGGSGNGKLKLGGGVYTRESHISIKNCIISGNSASFGAGVYAAKGIFMEDCVIADNVSEISGGGLYLGHNYPDTMFWSFEIKDTVIKNNHAGMFGAGMYCDSSSQSVINCEIIGNTISDSPDWVTAGGGIYCCNNSNLLLKKCTIRENSVHDYGGGIFSTDSAPVILSSQICNNSAIENDGGGVYIINASYSPTIYNCLIAGNKAGLRGGGLFSGNYSSIEIESCSFADNNASSGVGIYQQQGCTLILYNSIIWELGDDPFENKGFLSMRYCNADNDGNFNIDPLFVDGPRGKYYLSQIAAGQDVDSPCLNKGNIMMSYDQPYVDIRYATTRTDGLLDNEKAKKPLDTGYHYPAHIDFSMKLVPKGGSFQHGDEIAIYIDLDKVSPACNVDIFLVALDDEGKIFSAATWENELSPMLKGFMLPEKLLFYYTNLLSFDPFYDNPPFDPGSVYKYTFAIMATFAGTLNPVSNFEIVDFEASVSPF